MATTERSREEVRTPVLSDDEAELAKAAHRCIMAALDHSRAKAIALVDPEGAAQTPAIELPPAALRVIARLLGAMGERKPIFLVPAQHELTTVEAAHFLNVSRPFVVREIDEGRLRSHKVGSHRRIKYEDLVAYRNRAREGQKAALQALADDAQALELGY
jgi:excisionase family DNA binding protein